MRQQCWPRVLTVGQSTRWTDPRSTGLDSSVLGAREKTPVGRRVVWSATPRSAPTDDWAASLCDSDQKPGLRCRAGCRWLAAPAASALVPTAPPLLVSRTTRMTRLAKREKRFFSTPRVSQVLLDAMHLPLRFFALVLYAALAKRCCHETHRLFGDARAFSLCLSALKTINLPREMRIPSPERYPHSHNSHLGYIPDRSFPILFPTLTSRVNSTSVATAQLVPTGETPSPRNIASNHCRTVAQRARQSQLCFFANVHDRNDLNLHLRVENLPDEA